MLRRDFVTRLPVLTGGLVVGSLPLGACAGAAYLVPTVRPGGALVVPVASVPSGTGVLLEVASLDRPIYLHREADGEPVALLARCTHQGCQPDPVAGRLICPCHGSEFSSRGEVLQGPAERPLTRYAAEVVGDEVLIRVGGGPS